MLKVWLVVFTILQPNVEGRVQDIQMPNMDHCERFIKDVTPDYQATKGLVFNMRCEERRNTKEERK